MTDKSTCSREEAASRYAYDPTTGVLSWRHASTRGIQAGDPAGCVAANGYRYVSLTGKKALAHRVAWLLYFGEWPSSGLDHINGDTDDNRIANLRLATYTENGCNRSHQRNSSSKLKGVHFCDERGKWVAQIHKNKKTIPLGRFDRLEDAVAARNAASQRLHGKFGRPSYDIFT